MKVLFINKYDITGGAGIVATRLQHSLQKIFRIECRSIVGVKHSDEQNVFCSRKSTFKGIVERGLNIILNQMGIQYWWLPLSTPEIRKRTIDFSPDVISLHNIHGGYFDTSLLIELSRIAPIVWTLHDMWAFTGNAAHTFGDTAWRQMKACHGERHRFPRIGLPTGSWLLRRKKNIYQNSRLTIVTPSQWLFSQASTAPVFMSKEIVRIPNGIDLALFRPQKEEARRVLNIPQNASVLLFTAEKLTGNEYKGGERLIDILRIVNNKVTTKVHLLVVGKGNIRQLNEFKNLTVHAAGYIHDEKMMAHCYSASDLFVYPTQADTLPNALIESIACGTPAITNDIGGCGEIIKNGYNGYLVPPDATQLFAEHILTMIQDFENRQKYSIQTRSFAKKHFSLKSMAKAYYSLFEKVIERSIE